MIATVQIFRTNASPSTGYDWKLSRHCFSFFSCTTLLLCLAGKLMTVRVASRAVPHQGLQLPVARPLFSSTSRVKVGPRSSPAGVYVRPERKSRGGRGMERETGVLVGTAGRQRNRRKGRKGTGAYSRLGRLEGRPRCG